MNRPLRLVRTPSTAQERRRMLLPKVIGYFKMNTAKRANLLRALPGEPFWQRDYYEHVIRNRVELERIRDYIANNPLKWELDQLHPDNPSKW
jgi:REP element-mobilizing transposase RayT